MEDEIVEGQGSESEVENSPVAPEQEVNPEQGGGNGINPAWNELLESVPSSLHSQITPHLQKWDQNYQSGIQKVHSQYEPFKPFLEKEIPVDKLQYGLQLMQAIEERPGEVMEALKRAMGVDDEVEPEGSDEEQGQDPSDIRNHPEFKKVSEMVETMAQILVQQQQTAQQSQEDQALSKELDDLHKAHGDFDEEWVLTKALAKPDVPLEKHVAAYQEWEKGLLAKQRQPGPKVLGAGGGAPNSQVEVSKLGDKERRGLIAQMLQSASNQNG